MVRLFDDKICADIMIKRWEGNGYSCDISADYYDVGGLEYDSEKDAYRVKDVQYCIDILDDADEGINAECETDEEKVWEAFIDIVKDCTQQEMA